MPQPPSPACSSEERPLRVLLVSTQRAWHGGEEQARLLAEGLRSRGHECHVLARAGGQFARRMAELDFGVSLLPRGAALRSWLEIRNWIRHWNPQVVHLNDAHAVTRGGLFLWGLPQPVRVAARRVDFPIRSSLPYRLLCDRVVCVSRAVADICRRGGVPDGHLRVVHDGVAPHRARSGDRRRGRAALGLAEDVPLLLVVAKLTDHKGHRFLLDAMPGVLQRYPTACLALAGDGELTETLQAHARRLGLERNVRFLGFRQDVPDLLRAADLFVLPSRMEGLCTSVIDAMLAERPLVTTTAGGIPDLVLPEVLTSESDSTPSPAPVAWTVPPENSLGLQVAILEALDDPRERAARAERARRRAEQRFLAEHMVAATLDVYREALSDRGERASTGLRTAA